MTDLTMSADKTQEITITRLFDAPIELVFRSFTDADRIAKWWGPQGFDVPRCESDAREGGAFTIVMRGPDGVECPVAGSYLEFDPPRHLATREQGLDAEGNAHIEATTTIDLREVNGKTELTLVTRGKALTPEAIGMLTGMEAGWTQSLRCLDDVLTGAVDRQIVVMRMFPAQRERVFRAMTTRDELERWWGPEGSTVTTQEFDLRPGGVWRYRIGFPGGGEYASHLEFESIDEPVELSYTHPGTPGVAQDPPCRTTISLDEFMGNTVLTSRLVFESVDVFEAKTAGGQAAVGAERAVDRLGSYVSA